MSDSVTDSPERPAVPLLPAASVLLLRESAGAGIEVLLQHRQPRLKFMGGKWVFPGGRVDALDASPAALARIASIDAADCATGLCAVSGEALAADAALSQYVAACRETFEEAGILLARRSDGSECPDEVLERCAARREAVAADPALFAGMLEAEDLLLDLGRMVYWSHWVTPSAEATRRYDTRFFAAAVPARQFASADGGESIDSRWMRPRDACDAAATRSLPMVPPTLLTLEDLDECVARHGSLATLLHAERGRATPPVVPRVDGVAANRRVLMPWHPDYAGTAGHGVTADARWPAHLLRRASEIIIAGDFSIERTREPAPPTSTQD